MNCKMFFYILLGPMFLHTGFTMVIPKELKELMANIQSLESFMKAMKLGNITLGSPRPASRPGITGGSQPLVLTHHKIPSSMGVAGVASKRKKLQKVALGRSRVVSYSHDSSIPVILEDASCKPYPTVVKVPQPGHEKGIHYPFNVVLNRCAGSCQTGPGILECVPTATQDVNLLTFVVSWNSANDRVDDWHRAPRLIKLANHTKCGCKCIKKPSDCNPQTQIYVENTCSCDCKDRHKSCPLHQTWDPLQCKCICNPLQTVLCSKRSVWSKEKCSCVCKNTPCRTFKVKNPRNCRCYCSKSLPPCSKGLVRSRRDCICRPPISKK